MGNNVSVMVLALLLLFSGITAAPSSASPASK